MISVQCTFVWIVRTALSMMVDANGGGKVVDDVGRVDQLGYDWLAPRHMYRSCS